MQLINPMNADLPKIGNHDLLQDARYPLFLSIAGNDVSGS